MTCSQMPATYFFLSWARSIQSMPPHSNSWTSLNKGRPTWWHLLYYVYLLLNMFRMLIHPSSGACDYFVRYCVGCTVLTWGVLVLCSGIGCWSCGIRVQAEPLQYSLHNNTPSSRKLLKMDVLTSETRWAVNWHNKASVIRLVNLYSNIKMMHGPIRIRFLNICFVIILPSRPRSSKWAFSLRTRHQKTLHAPLRPPP